MSVCLVCTDINMALTSRHTDRQEAIVSHAFFFIFLPSVVDTRTDALHLNKKWARTCCFITLQSKFSQDAFLHSVFHHFHLSDWFTLCPSFFFFKQTAICYQTRMQTSLWQAFTLRVQSARFIEASPGSATEHSGSEGFHAGHALLSPGSGTALVCQVSEPDCL